MKSLAVVGLMFDSVGYREVTRSVEFRVHAALVILGYSVPVAELGEYLVLGKEELVDNGEIQSILDTPVMEDSLNIDYAKTFKLLEDKGYTVSMVSDIDLENHNAIRFESVEEY